MPGPPRPPARTFLSPAWARAALAAAVMVGLCAGTAAMPGRPAFAAGNQAPATPGSVTLSGLDLHDGTVVQVGGKVYAYGTRYGCGFRWLHRSPWCGYGVSEAASLTGRWSRPKLLFSAHSVIRANWKGDNGKTWDAMCGGVGCFNPRMVRAPDGKYLLWFNAPGDKSRHANPYWVMTCAGLAGPCGDPHKPSIWGCNEGGDFSIAVAAGQKSAAIICSGTDHDLTVESLTRSFTDGVRTIDTHVAPGPNEGVGVYFSSGFYTAVFSDPICGYCSGPPIDKVAAPGDPVAVQAGYSTAPRLTGPWTYRGILSDGFCAGQPRSIFTVNGRGWEWVDEWNGTTRETGARIHLIPLGPPPWSCGAQGQDRLSHR
jgi:hypothetical protein